MSVPITDPALLAHVQRRLDVLGAIRRLLIDRLRVQREPEEIDPDTPLFGTGLGLDSIDAVELIVHLEGDFGVRLPNDITGRAEMRTVNSLVDLVLTVGDRKEEHDAR